MDAKNLLQVFVGLLLVCFLWRRFYHAGPVAAYYELAGAFEAQDAVQLQQLTDYYTRADLVKLARPYGGMRKLGRAMKQSPHVDSAIHMLLSVDVFATDQEKPLLI